MCFSAGCAFVAVELRNKGSSITVKSGSNNQNLMAKSLKFVAPEVYVSSSTAVQADARSKETSFYVIAARYRRPSSNECPFGLLFSIWACPLHTYINTNQLSTILLQSLWTLEGNLRQRGVFIVRKLPLRPPKTWCSNGWPNTRCATPPPALLMPVEMSAISIVCGSAQGEERPIAD